MHVKMGRGAARTGRQENAGDHPLAGRPEECRYAARQPLQRNIEEVKRRARREEGSGIPGIHRHHAMGHMFACEPSLGTAASGQAGQTGDIERPDRLPDPGETGGIDIKLENPLLPIIGEKALHADRRQHVVQVDQFLGHVHSSPRRRGKPGALPVRALSAGLGVCHAPSGGKRAAGPFKANPKARAAPAFADAAPI